jgi:hypothetical protein
VTVERADGARLRFLVEQVRSYSKASFPTAAVFGPAPSAALRLVTCGGEFDRQHGSYHDNLVVFARLAPWPADHAAEVPAGRYPPASTWVAGTGSAGPVARLSREVRSSAGSGRPKW